MGHTQSKMCGICLPCVKRNKGLCDVGIFVPWSICTTNLYGQTYVSCEKIMEANGMLSKYLFLCVQVIWNVTNKLTK